MEMLKFIIAIAIYIAVGRKVLVKAARNLSHGLVFDENFLMVVATFGALALGEYLEAISVMLLYRIGEHFQDKAVDNSRRSISALLDIMPDHANLQGDDGELIELDPEDVEVGSIIVIKPGERVPLDGIILEGDSRIDTAALTGESVPRSVRAGDEVFSGTVNLNGLLKVQVTKPSDESTASRIIELVEDASDRKAEAEKFITKFAKIYTPAVCAATLALVLIPSLFTGEWLLWLKRALIFLVVSCPCALVISIPLSFFAGLGAASSSGILVKGGNFIEALAKADTMVFDKTGTLSKGVFTVQAVHSEVMDEAQLLDIAAHAESFSNHPIAVSIADEYRARSGKRPDKARVEGAKEYAGEGIVSIVDGREVACGNEKLMARVGSESEDCYLSGTQVHVAVDGEYRGHIIISDVIKEDAADAVKTLKALGIKRTVMLTGDREAAARSAAEQTGVDEYHSELSPEDKLAKLEELIAGGAKVAFAGDGINDAPVIAAADVGIAMGDMGSQSAVEAADIVLMNDRPSDIALAVKISRKTMRIVYQNIVMSIGVKLAVMVLAALGMANMWMAIFGDVGVCIIAIFNSMRALKIKS